MERVTTVIGNLPLCLQSDWNLWHFCIKNKASREELLTNGIKINNLSISFFNTNPYSSGNRDPNQKQNT